MINDSESPTSVAVLGTLAEFHPEPLPYDLAALVRLVSRLCPDLLCLDITPEEWRQRSFGGLPPEYRDALLPLAYQTDIVVAPIAGARPPIEPSTCGWKGKLIGWFRRWLGFLQQTAPDLDAINQGWRHDLADFLYGLSAWLAGPKVRQSWNEHTRHLTRAIVDLAHRDPGTRILVVLSVRYCHHIRHALRKHPEINLVKYADL